MKTFFWSRWFLILSIGILFLSFLTRFYLLGSVPHGMTWDEAAIAYNGHAIWTTRRDEWLTRLPVSFRSFGDYKAPAAIYLNGAFTKLFGMNLWAVRLPFALAGVAAVGGIILLVREWGNTFGWTKKESLVLALIAGAMLATSPWHIHYSRTGFESGISLTLLIWFVYFWLKAMNQEKKSGLYLAISTFLAAINLYVYHSAKLVIPLLGIILLWQFRKSLKSKIVPLCISGVGATALLWPLLKDSLYGKGLERAGTLIVAKTDSFFELMVILWQQFFAHLSPTFLVMGETHSFRHGDGSWGVLLWPTFVLLLLGLAAIFKKKNLAGWWLALTMIVVGILPAALGAELVPHSNRALLALPGFFLLCLEGLRLLSEVVKKSSLNQQVIGSHGEKNMVWVSVMGTILLWHSLLFVTYLSHYFGQFAKVSAEDFADGYIEAFEYVKQHESEVDKIVFTSDYGQPYIFALFVRKTNPIWYQGGSLVKYEFKDVDNGDLSRTNAIIVGSKNDLDLDDQTADKLVYGSDGAIRFKIFHR